MFNDVYCSARQVAEAYEKEKVDEEMKRREREFDKNASLEIINELKQQNTQLQKQYDESKVELEKSHKLNKKMMIIALASAFFGALSFIATIVIAIVK